MIGLGWRVRHWSADVVAVSGSPSSPVVVHREVVTLLDDPALREAYHTATTVPRDVAPALIASAAAMATATAETAMRSFVSSLGDVAAVGVVAGTRQLPELSRILTKHALLHAAERDLYEQAIVDGAARVSLPVRTIPATGKLFEHASQVLGVNVATSLAAVGKSIGPPWQKDHREAAAAALVALEAVATQ